MSLYTVPPGTFASSPEDQEMLRELSEPEDYKSLLRLREACNGIGAWRTEGEVGACIRQMLSAAKAHLIKIFTDAVRCGGGQIPGTANGLVTHISAGDYVSGFLDTIEGGDLIMVLLAHKAKRREVIGRIAELYAADHAHDLLIAGWSVE